MEETVYGLELKIKEKDLKNKNLQDKVLFHGVTYLLIFNLPFLY